MVQAEAARGRGLGLSELAPRVVQSEIRAMTQESDRVGGVNLAQGVCDTEVPHVVAEGAIKAIRDARWSSPNGICGGCPRRTGPSAPPHWRC